MLDKKQFSAQLNKFTNKRVGISFYLRFREHYELIYEWRSETAQGKFNPMMYAQLIDLHKCGPQKYVVPDLHFDCVKENVTTAHKLFKYLDKWVTDSITKYEVSYATSN